MSFFLGIDGGGSKTEIVLADEAGATLARAAGGGANLRRTSPAALREIIAGCLSEIRRGAGLKRLEVEAAGAGFAGAGRANANEKARSAIEEFFPGARVYVVGDMEVALEAAVGGGAGVVLIAGTGSIAYGRNQLGQQARAGGGGALMDDKGSGFEIGRQALEAARRARNARGPQTALSEALPAGELAAKITLERVAEVAVLVPVVVEAARQGDTVAREILQQSAAALAEHVLAVVRQLRLEGAAARVFAAGGVFAASEEMLVAVAERIRREAPQARVGMLRVSPAEGGARLAQRLWLQEQAAAGARR